MAMFWVTRLREKAGQPPLAYPAAVPAKYLATRFWSKASSTVIDGGSIKTSKISAGSITPGLITEDKLVAGSIKMPSLMPTSLTPPVQYTSFTPSLSTLSVTAAPVLPTAYPQVFYDSVTGACTVTLPNGQTITVSK